MRRAKAVKPFDHGLSPEEIEHKLKEIAKCKERGVKPSKCEQCKGLSKFLYYTAFKRGATHLYYFCEKCFDRTTVDKEVSAEDYDCL